MDKELNFLIYNTPEEDVSINAVVKDETIWLTQKAMAELFDVEVPAISKHLSNIFSEGELQSESTVSKMEIVQTEGSRNVKRTLDFYNLDSIISVGYRVNSRKATNFRIWATSVLKEYMTKGFAMKALQSVDMNDPKVVEEFKATHYVTDEDIATMQEIKILEERTIQDYRSTYNDIRDWLRREKAGKDKENSSIDWDDVVFEVDLLKSQEINLDYILELIFEKNKKLKDKETLVDEVRRIIRSSTGNRAKESLVVDFINQTDLDKIQDKASIIDAFFLFAQAEQKKEAENLISDEELNADAAKRYILSSLKKEYASENGTELNEILPKMSPLNPKYLTKKQSVFQKIAAFVEKFKGVGGTL